MLPACPGSLRAKVGSVCNSRVAVTMPCLLQPTRKKLRRTSKMQQCCELCQRCQCPLPRTQAPATLSSLTLPPSTGCSKLASLISYQRAPADESGEAACGSGMGRLRPRRQRHKQTRFVQPATPGLLAASSSRAAEKYQGSWLGCLRQLWAQSPVCCRFQAGNVRAAARVPGQSQPDRSCSFAICVVAGRMCCWRWGTTQAPALSPAVSHAKGTERLIAARAAPSAPVSPGEPCSSAPPPAARTPSPFRTSAAQVCRLATTSLNLQAVNCEHVTSITGSKQAIVNGRLG